MNNPKHINELITEALAIEAQDAKETGTIGYMARALVQATLPHKAAKGIEFVRTNGNFSLSIMSPASIGLPYGNIPRLVLAWLTTEAVQTKDRNIILGNSLTDFMHDLGLVPTGGRWGSITRLKEQLKRLFASSITCTYTGSYNGSVGDSIYKLNLIDHAQFWWEPKKLDQLSLFDSVIILSQNFFDEVTQNPVPIDLRALRALKRSPMALDIYCWLTYRMFSVKRNTPPIPWQCLQTQFGADYAHTRNFKLSFLEQLKKVSVIYPEARFEPTETGLILKPSPTHILPK